MLLARWWRRRRCGSPRRTAASRRSWCSASGRSTTCTSSRIAHGVRARHGPPRPREGAPPGRASRSGRSRRTTVRAASTSGTACSRCCSRTERTTRSAARTCCTGGNPREHRCAPSRNGAHLSRVRFASPLVLLALLAVPAALGAAALAARRGPGARSRSRTWQCSRRSRLSPRRPRRRLIPVALLVLALALAAGAAAHPQARVPVRVDNATIVLLVDVSGSMSARDVEPTRLDAAVAAMRWFVQPSAEGLQGRASCSSATTSTVLAAPTADHERIAQTLDLLMPDSGTAIGAGLVTAVAVAKSSLARDGVIVAPGQPASRRRSCCSPTGSRPRA